ncbi:hypothetical protein OBBRIDRAFT_839496 [Obba rivulosa]|uniref:C2H2-type domain-containing protein n=1 Tax=Obba rivulosa TaxID=1052685 RepID=A0A8E2DJG6_9APHY|nr:hypothetical protein OBBRIDRAFT_839496 [Obba rivulosa]
MPSGAVLTVGPPTVWYYLVGNPLSSAGNPAVAALKIDKPPSGYKASALPCHGSPSPVPRAHSQSYKPADTPPVHFVASAVLTRRLHRILSYLFSIRDSHLSTPSKMTRISADSKDKRSVKPKPAGLSDTAQRRHASINALGPPDGPYFCDARQCVGHTYNCVVPEGASFICPIPGCRFHCTKRNSMVLHHTLHAVLQHTNMKVKKCDECDWLTWQVSGMNSHRTVHTGERPWICHYPGCGKTYSDAGMLTRHKKVHPHVIALNASPGCRGFATKSKAEIRKARIAKAEELGQPMLLKERERCSDMASQEIVPEPQVLLLDAGSARATDYDASTLPAGPQPPYSYESVSVDYSYSRGPVVASLPDYSLGAAEQGLYNATGLDFSHAPSRLFPHDPWNPPPTAPSSVSSFSSIPASPGFLSSMQYTGPSDVYCDFSQVPPLDLHTPLQHGAFNQSTAYTNPSFSTFSPGMLVGESFGYARATSAADFYDQQQPNLTAGWAHAHNKLELNPPTLHHVAATPANFFPDPSPQFYLARTAAPFPDYTEQFFSPRYL